MRRKGNSGKNNSPSQKSAFLKFHKFIFKGSSDFAGDPFFCSSVVCAIQYLFDNLQTLVDTETLHHQF